MADDVSSFWGPVTSTKEWCELNYVRCSYVAEFFISSLFEKRFSVLHMSNIIISRGSMIYHATLRQMQQQGDETPMVWEMLLYIYILYSPDWHYKSTMPTFLFLYGAVFADLRSQICFGIGFLLHYALLCLLCVPRTYKYYGHTDDRSAKQLAKLCVATLLVGAICWLCDHLFCKHISQWYFNPQGHALWHVRMGFNVYFANTFLMYCLAQQREWNPKIKPFLGFFPYVKIHKPKAQQHKLLLRAQAVMAP